MLLRFTFEADGIVKLPKSYNHELQGFFYANMDRLFAEFLHESGFIHGGRKFKLFTFSKLRYRSLEKKNGFLWIETPLTVSFSSPLFTLSKSLAENFLKGETFRLGRNMLFLLKAEVVEYKLSPQMLIRCLSPVVVYRTPPGSRKYEYLTPYQKEFYELLEKNLRKKYELVYGRTYRGELEIKPEGIKPEYRKKIVFKGTLIEAWEGIFRIEAEEDMVRVALYAGIGVKNSAGFGMVEPC